MPNALNVLNMPASIFTRFDGNAFFKLKKTTDGGNSWRTIDIPYQWYWENIVGRLFGGFVPGTWLAFFDVTANIGHRSGSPTGSDILQSSWAILGYAKVWIAVGVGCAMTYAAIRLRRYRDEG